MFKILYFNGQYESQKNIHEKNSRKKFNKKKAHKKN